MRRSLPSLWSGTYGRTRRSVAGCRRCFVIVRGVKPLVSIIVPTHNNEATVVRTLNSLIEQTLRDTEIVIVDDASTDATMSLCRDAQRFDPRIIIVPLDENQTALQARRIGVEHATGTYVMFCDGDDELVPQAAEEASSFALGGGYEVVHFGTTVVSATGSKHAAWERALDPFGTELFGDDILLCSAFGRPGSKINGHIWNKLYERRLVEAAWKPIDPGLRLPRAQDVYQTLLILAKATRYGGLSSSLYRYSFRAGKSGNVANRDSFQHFLASTRTYQAVEEHLSSDHWKAPAEFDANEMLDRLRDQFIDNQLNYWFRLPRPADAALGDLLRQWGPDLVLRTLADRHPGRVRMVIEAFSRLNIADLQFPKAEFASRRRQHIALLGNISGTGGVQKVMAVQAKLLIQAGYSVTVLSFTHEPESLAYEFPPSVTHRSIGPRGEVGTGVSELTRAIRECDFSVVLNHDNYSALLPWVAAVTRTMGVPSALFLHSFALRALHDFRGIFAYLPEIARTYDMTVTLSEADRMWWEASGVPNVVALPNFGPDSPIDPSSKDIIRDSDGEGPAAPSTHPPRVDLLWVGRLQDDTKNISGLLEAFAQVVTQRPHTTLAIVGGEQNPGERDRLEQMAERLDIREQVLFVGPVQDVGLWYRSAKVFLATSAIEGFNLTLVEAQAYGLPVAMYALPYLETVVGNPGIVSVGWGATERLANATLELLEDPKRAEQIGAAGRDFALRFSLEAYDTRLRSIVNRLSNLQPHEKCKTTDTTSEVTTAIVPISVIGELYRLYERMYHRTTSELQAAKRDSANLRQNLSQLKRSLADSKAQHQNLEKAIAQIEKKKPATLAPQKKAQVRPALTSGVGGVWPLWRRQGSQPFDAPSSAAFDDVALTDTVALPAAWALDSGLFGATSGRQFNGAGQVTRYEFIDLLHRLAGAPTATSELALYRDLDSGDAATAWAFQRGILKPPSSANALETLPAWKPGGPLLRRSAAMMLFRAAGGPQYRSPHVSPYADLTVNQKVYKEMCWAAHQGILPSVRRNDDTLIFDEKRLMTRSETVIALFRQMVGPLAMSDQG